MRKKSRKKEKRFVDITTEAIASTRSNVDLFTTLKYAKTTWKMKTAKLKNVSQDILEDVNGLKAVKAVREKTVTTCMLLEQMWTTLMSIISNA